MENKINPIGLKGNEINERIKALMGVSTINENNTKSVVELTKIGPDGKAYAIVRENHAYFIKSTDKKNGLISEDFNYIGGLQNKSSESYNSYAKAIKHLNLKFNSLSEQHNAGSNINVFKNDNLLTESGIAGFSSMGSGFANESDLEVEETLYEEDEEDEETLSEEEKAVTDMMESDDEEVPENDEDPTKQPGYVHENKLSISRAIANMDSIIDDLNEGTLKKKVYTLK
jgi:hypothetical protein